MRYLLLLILLMLGLAYSNAKPMESLEKYNVIMVHGASNSTNGLQELCNGADTLPEASDFHKAYMQKIEENDKFEENWGLGTAVNMMGGYHSKDTLTHWLDTEVFEKYRHFKSDDPEGASPIYIQRSFVNPANSPIANARELGGPTWNGLGKCSKRRSLIEEAQEVKAGGRGNLKRLRTSKNYFDIPSRNILIGYSMGGVASSEYVRGNFCA